MTLFVVEHDVDLVVEISHHVIVLDAGRVIAEGTPREVQEHPEVVRARLGEGGPADWSRRGEPIHPD